MTIRRKMFTVDEFEQFVKLPQNANRRFEYINGELIEVPSNPYSSQIAALIIAALVYFLRGKNLGHVTGEQGGYIVAGARVAPDVAYISKARQAALVKEGYNPLAPDLAVEVISPSDDEALIADKIGLYMQAGVLLWVVYPPRFEVEVHTPGQPVQTLGLNDRLDGGDLLPGFSLPIRDIFPE
jgi:Uma2 family endonuclease